jgi:hypothetical protein
MEAGKNVGLAKLASTVLTDERTFRLQVEDIGVKTLSVVGKGEGDLGL